MTGKLPPGIIVHQRTEHKVTLARTAEMCLKIYSKSLHDVLVKKSIIRDVQPYDAVILD